MRFTELESIMLSRGITTLANIARTLNTTPQAVSNWKARDQVPFRIIAKLNQQIENNASPSSPFYQEDTISIPDILMTLSEQLKVILLVPFISIFLTLTYVKFIQPPEYISWASILLPESSDSNLGALAGLASQFGVGGNLPTGSKADLSSPSLFPDLIESRTFAEKILDRKFYTEKYGKELTLLAILTHGNTPPEKERNTLVTSALAPLSNMINYDRGTRGPVEVIKVTAPEAKFAKELAEVILIELESLNRFYKSMSVNEKIIFINNRIMSVEEALKLSEQRLKEFNEQNRQISSPALQLDRDRLSRDVEIQKGIYLTLKQQLELGKIEEVQEASIVQILDRPQLSLYPSNKNLKMSLLLAGIIGLSLGILVGFYRNYMKKIDVDDRKKFRRVKNFINKKTKDLILDRRISGLVSILLLIGLPFYLGHKSQNPVFFGMYSGKLMLINTIYIFVLLFSISLFIYRTRNKN